jgi:hypothetical protein
MITEMAKVLGYRKAITHLDVDRVYYPIGLGAQWQKAQEIALTEAKRRAVNWRQSVVAMRGYAQLRFKHELERWNKATREAILGVYLKEYQQATFFGAPQIPSAIKRRLRQHEDRMKEQHQFLEKRIRFKEPAIEPLGVLLRVPLQGIQA